MKKITILLIIVFFLGLVSCTKNSENLIEENLKSTQENIVNLPSEITTPLPTATKIATTIASETVEISSDIQLASTPLVTATPTKKSVQIPGVETKCLNYIDPASLINSNNEKYIQGEIALLSTTYKIDDSYILDLDTGEKVSLPDEMMDYLGNGVISPDGAWLAYTVVNENRSSNLLLLVNESGLLEKKIDLMDLPLSTERLYAMVDWMDDDGLVFEYKGPGPDKALSPNEGATLILNPFTEEVQQFKSDYEDIYFLSPNFLRKWNNYFPTLSVYNPALDRVLYLSFDGIVLWDLALQQQIKLFPDNPDEIVTRPVWAPDGARFVIDLDSPTGRNLFLISKDGEEEQITFLSGLAVEDMVNFSWSPDGNSIAFWYLTYGNKYDYDYDVAVLNLASGKIANYCIRAFNWRRSYPQWDIVWAPDSNGLAVAARHGSDPQRSIAVVIDLISHTAYKIAEDAIPLGWMTTE